MTISKNKITRKLITSYIIAFLLSFLGFILFYTQLDKFAEIANKSVNFNENVYLITETITDLYEMESIGKNLIKTNDSTLLIKYQSKLGKVNTSIDELVLKYPDTSQRIKINSIKDLLRRKNNKVTQLIRIYENKKAEFYYASAIAELKKIDPSFKDYSYINRFKKLKPHQRRYLISLLEYSKADNENNLSNKTIDSIANSVTSVLLELSRKEKQLQQKIEAKENEILESDRVLTLQIRSILTSLEFRELQLYQQQSRESKKIVSNTYKIVLFFTLLTLLMAVLFLYLIGKDLNANLQYKLGLEKAKKYSDQLLQSRENLINMVTHDIRAPLNTIMGYLDLLQPNTTSDAKYISQMQNSSEYMLHLVNDLLDFSRMEAGKIYVEKVNFQPNLIIENAISQACPKEENEQVEFLVAIDKKLESIYRSDPFRIKQILVNLITNAFKFTKEGFVKIEATLEDRNLDFPNLKLLVADSGKGIPSKKQQIIFEPFSQNSKIDKVKGYGLGLYITKNLVEAFNGSITVKSVEGEGSVFICNIPLEKAKPTNLQQLKSEENFDAQNANKNVVLIDDDEAQLVFLEEILTRHQIKYTSFSNATKALDFIESTLPSLVITDIQMPIIDGFTLARNLKGNDKTSQIPILGLTGNNMFEATDFSNAGFADNLLKPYKPCYLVDKINNILDLDPAIRLNNKLKNIAVGISNHFDLEDIFAYLDNDTDAVHKVIQTFTETTEKIMESWLIAIEFENSSELIKIAHKLKPMFRQLKAKTISKMLNEIELNQITNKRDFYITCKQIRVCILKLTEELKLVIS